MPAYGYSSADLSTLRQSGSDPHNHDHLTVDDDMQWRTIFFTDQAPDGEPSGQQCRGWLPVGQYLAIAKETLAVSSLGQTENVQSVRLLRIDGDRLAVYYVSIGTIPASVYDRLREFGQ